MMDEPIIIGETEYEKFLGVSTKDNVYNSLRCEHYNIYEPTSYCALQTLFNEFPLDPYDTIVDFGCGKGRVLFYCNQRFLCNVKGIEHDDDVYELLENNKAYYSTRFRGQESKISLYHGNCEDYEIQESDNVFYFFNPFDHVVFDRIIDRIVKSTEQNPRKVSVIMYYPEDGYKKVMKDKGFALHKLIRLPNYDLDVDEKIYIYEFLA